MVNIAFPKEIPNAFKQSRQTIGVAFAAAAGITNSMLHLLTFDIIRDFLQIISLFFENILSDAFDLMSESIGRVAAFISLDFSAVVDGINPVGVYYFICVLAGLLLIGYIGFISYTRYFNPDFIRQGHETVSWDVQRVQNKKRTLLLQYALIAGMYVYLPISRTALEVISCDPTIGRALLDSNRIRSEDCHKVDVEGTTDQIENCACDQWEHYNTLRTAAIIFVVAYTIGFPTYCGWLVYKNRPYGSPEDPTKCYDEEGELVQYTDTRYRDDLQNDPNQINCPYKFMYDGYERNWAYYKIISMVTKFLFVVPVVLAWKYVAVQSIVSLVIAGALGGFAFYSSPFLDPMHDIVDTCGRLTTFLTLLFGLIGSYRATSIMEILILIINSINGCAMGLLGFWGQPMVRRNVKSVIGLLQFSDSVTQVTGPARRIIPKWNIASEIKRRIWHPFWEVVLLEQGPEVASRLRDLQLATRNYGKVRILDHWEQVANPEMAKIHQELMTNLEGVDVYYKKDAHDDVVNRSTGFGKMYVQPYPFHCVMVYDDSDDYTFLWGNDCIKLYEQNQDPEIQRRKLVRQKLRALEGHKLTYYLERMETHSVADGQETVTNSDGTKEVKTRYSNVSVQMRYSQGHVNCIAKYSLPMSAGFNFKLTLTDGQGQAVAPRTGQVHVIRNTAVLSMEQLNINTSFDNCHALEQLFNNTPNDQIWTSGLVKWQEEVQKYRQDRMHTIAEQESILSSAFWLLIYDNDSATRTEIETYFKTHESNKELQNMLKSLNGPLAFLFAKMSFVELSEANAIWYIFWADLCETNGDISKIHDLQDDLDPNIETSIVYSPKTRSELEIWLEERNLMGKYRWIKPTTLDALYRRMSANSNETQDSNASEHVLLGPMITNESTPCAYQTRRVTRANRVAQESLRGIQAGTIRNTVAVTGSAYIPRDPQSSRPTSVMNPLSVINDGEDQENNNKDQGNTEP